MTFKKLIMHNSLTQKLENISKRFREVEILLSQSDISKEILSQNLEFDDIEIIDHKNRKYLTVLLY